MIKNGVQKRIRKGTVICDHSLRRSFDDVRKHLSTKMNVLNGFLSIIIVVLIVVIACFSQPVLSSNTTSATAMLGQDRITRSFADFKVPFASVANSVTSRFSFNSSGLPQTSIPLPTNTWWQNLVLDDGGTQISCPPYLMRLPVDGQSRVEIGWPKVHVIEEAMWQVWIDDWHLIWDNNERQPFARQVTDYDDLSVTVQWPTSRASSWARQTLVKATPYTTVEFQQMAHVQLKTRHAIIEFSRYSFNSWKILLNNGQTWIVFVIADATQNVDWQLNGINMLQLTCNSNDNKGFTGVIRVAAVPDLIDESLVMLDKYHASYPVGGTFSWQIQNNQDPTTNAKELVISKFTYRRAGPNPSVPLLMLALPHHTHVLMQPQIDARAFSNGRGYRNSKGRMSAVIGNEWIMHDKAPEINWHDKLNYSQLPGDWQRALVDSLRVDVEHSQTPTTSESYWFGKQIARLARLALVAEQLNQPDLLNKLLDRLAEGFTPWLTTSAPSNQAAFRYDSTNGGLLTPAGASGNADADFGHGRYNDHHFHHGYFVYAAAVLARKRPNWWSTHQSAILSVLLDYICPLATSLKASRAAAPFPRFRHFDAYEGHSWASGLSVFADNRNQESTSEAINAYYAALLLANTTRQSELEVAARVLLAMELRAARTYWQMMPPLPVHAKGKIYYVADTTTAMSASNPPVTRELVPWQTKSSTAAGVGVDGDELANGQRVIYPAPYRHRGTTGVLWTTKMDYATWFGKQSEFIHGIQLIPFTPVSRQLYDRQWLQRIDGILDEALSRPSPPIEDGWKGFILMARAYGHTTRRNTEAIKTLWSQLLSMPNGNGAGNGWDNGNTKTNALVWVATCLQNM